MKHLGDITKIHGDAVDIVDVVTGGSPCQDLSVAGKRAGLAGERSGLFMEQIRIIKEMRDECERRLYDAGADYNRTDIKPRYMVWENVAGALSSGTLKGGDFRCVLEETAKVADKDAYVPGLEGGKWGPCGCILGNGWSIAWRLHDSQWFGVPQRRKRICLLADFNGDTAGKVLFELQRETTNRDTEQAIVDIGTESRSEVQSVSKGLSGDIAQSGKEGESVTEDTERRAGEASAFTLKIRGGANTYIKSDGSIGTAGKGPLIQTEKSGTLGVSQDQTLIAFEPGAASRVYGIGSYDSNAMKSDNPHSGIYEADTSRTLDLNGGNPGCNQGGMAVVCLEGNGQRESHKGDGYKESDIMYTLNSTEYHAVAVESHAQDARYNVGEVNQPLLANMEHDSANGGLVMVVENHPNDSRVKISEDGMVQTLSGRMGTGGGNVPMVMESINGEISGTLDASYYKGCGERQGVEREVVAMTTEMTPKIDEKDKGFSLRSRDYKDPQCVAVCQSVVRRLTPMECERLQGFPDNWTNIGDWVDSKGKTHKGESDSPRYKALGNSIALPFWAWMAERMMPYLPENPTMASLFDGIGGFPIVFSRCGCKPVWASEIEEFPIAVTKVRFSE